MRNFQPTERGNESVRGGFSILEIICFKRQIVFLIREGAVWRLEVRDRREEGFGTSCDCSPGSPGGTRRFSSDLS